MHYCLLTVLSLLDGIQNQHTMKSQFLNYILPSSSQINANLNPSKRRRGYFMKSVKPHFRDNDVEVELIIEQEVENNIHYEDFQRRNYITINDSKEKTQGDLIDKGSPKQSIENVSGRAIFLSHTQGNSSKEVIVEYITENLNVFNKFTQPLIEKQDTDIITKNANGINNFKKHSSEEEGKEIINEKSNELRFFKESLNEERNNDNTKDRNENVSSSNNYEELLTAEQVKEMITEKTHDLRLLKESSIEKETTDNIEITTEDASSLNNYEEVVTEEQVKEMITEKPHDLRVFKEPSFEKQTTDNIEITNENANGLNNYEEILSEEQVKGMVTGKPNDLRFLKKTSIEEQNKDNIKEEENVSINTEEQRAINEDAPTETTADKEVYIVNLE